MVKLQNAVTTLWARSLRRGRISLLRERDWLTACGALIGVFLLLQLMMFALLGTESIQHILESKTSLTLEMLEDAPDQDLQQFLNTLQQKPYIKKLTYITKEQAYAQMKKQDPELIQFMEEFALDNPFPETIAITLHSLQNYELLTAFIKEDQWRNIIDPAFLSSTTDQEEYVYDLLRITGVGRSLALFFLVLTIATLLCITTELVRERILRRSEEILVEHLSGAYPFSILLPFAIEASLLLAIAIVVSLILGIFMLAALPVFIPSITQHPTLNEVFTQMQNTFIMRSPIIIGFEILSIPIIGWLGAWLGSIKKINPRHLILHRH